MRKSWNPNNRSKAELLIDNWLYTRHLAHAYERRMPVPEDAYADFFIPLGECYIEYWGLDTQEYGATEAEAGDLQEVRVPGHRARGGGPHGTRRPAAKPAAAVPAGRVPVPVGALKSYRL